MPINCSTARDEPAARMTAGTPPNGRRPASVSGHRRTAVTHGLPALLCLVCTAVTGIQAEDWPQWMGPGRDNIWHETGIVSDFPDGGLPVLWRTEIAGGYSGPAVADGKVVITDYVTSDDVKVDNFNRAEFSGNERILCLNESDGKVIWKHEYPVRYTVSYPAGPRCTPVIEENRVYTLGTEGHLFCLDLNSGSIIWSRDLKQDYSTKAALWGYSAHPLIDGDNLLCLAGGPGSHIVAFHKLTGEEQWKAQSAPEQGYSPPTIIEAGGARQLILLKPNGVASVDPASGEEFWQVPYSATNGSIIMAPLVVGDYLYVAGYDRKSLLLKLDTEKPGAAEVWRDNRNAVCPVNVQPYVDGNLVIGMDQKGILKAVEIPSGDTVWESTELVPGRPAGTETAFLVRNGERIISFTERGELVLAEIDRQGCRVIDRTKVIEQTNTAFGRDVVWSMPAFANRHAYVRNDNEIICVDLAE